MFAFLCFLGKRPLGEVWTWKNSDLLGDTAFRYMDATWVMPMSVMQSPGSKGSMKRISM